jgi:hypothetical protein
MTDRKPWGILGLTDNPQPPVVAKAKIGQKASKVVNGKTIEYPQRLDFIRFVEPQTGRELPEYAAVFGAKPTGFNALLAGDTLEQCVDVAWKRFSAKGLKCRGDGVTGFDRETGESRPCAGSYSADPDAYQCPFAKPGERNGKATPPECKPVLSLRLVVPQIPGLGIVQIDTGGAASSIPTLVWQLRTIEQSTGGHMAGIAVQVHIRAFPDKMGGTAYGWQLTPLLPEQATDLRTHIEGLVRVEAQMPHALPPMDELPEADIYGLPAPGETVQEEQASGEPEIPEEWADRIIAGEGMFMQALDAVVAPEAKKAAILAGMEHNRDVAAAMGTWEDYHGWLAQQAERLTKQAEKAAGTQGALV